MASYSFFKSADQVSVATGRFVIWKLSCVGKLVNFYSSVSQSIAQTLTQSLFVCLVSQLKITSRKSDLP